LMEINDQLIVFILDNQLLAIPLQLVERVIRAVAITPLRNAPAVIPGIIDYHGTVVPVFSLRKRLGFPEKPLASSDRFLILQLASRKLALVIDEIHHITTDGENPLPDPEKLEEALETEGITRCKDGLILIYDPEKFLSSSEVFELQKALKQLKRKEDASHE